MPHTGRWLRSLDRKIFQRQVLVSRGRDPEILGSQEHSPIMPGLTGAKSRFVKLPGLDSTTYAVSTLCQAYSQSRWAKDYKLDIAEGRLSYLVCQSNQADVTRNIVALTIFDYRTLAASVLSGAAYGTLPIPAVQRVSNRLLRTANVAG